MPCVNFPDQLLAAYPDAKVVLTTRDPDKWIASMESSFYRIIDSPVWKVLPYVLPVSELQFLMWSVSFSR